MARTSGLTTHAIIATRLLTSHERRTNGRSNESDRGRKTEASHQSIDTHRDTRFEFRIEPSVCCLCPVRPAQSTARSVCFTPYSLRQCDLGRQPIPPFFGRTFSDHLQVKFTFFLANFGRIIILPSLFKLRCFTIKSEMNSCVLPVRLSFIRSHSSSSS